jgi:hypothetical protein
MKGLLLIAEFLATPPGLTATEPTKPNIVFLLIDDLGYAVIGPFGNTN